MFFISWTCQIVKTNLEVVPFFLNNAESQTYERSYFNSLSTIEGLTEKAMEKKIKLFSAASCAVLWSAEIIYYYI